MLGLFNLDTVGRFVVSGDEPVDLLWDLFDQIALGANIVTELGGATVIVPNPQELPDAAERQALHSTPEWVAAHSRHFVSKLGDGTILYPIELPQELFFDLHTVDLLGHVINRTSSSRDSLRRTNILGYKFGWGTPEYLEGLKSLPSHDFPYDHVSPTTTINYMLLKGVLELKDPGRAEEFGIVSADDVAAFQARVRDESEAIRAEQDRLVKERVEQRKSRRRKRS